MRLRGRFRLGSWSGQACGQQCRYHGPADNLNPSVVVGLLRPRVILVPSPTRALHGSPPAVPFFIVVLAPGLRRYKKTDLVGFPDRPSVGVETRVSLRN